MDVTWLSICASSREKTTNCIVHVLRRVRFLMHSFSFYGLHYQDPRSVATFFLSILCDVCSHIFTGGNKRKKLVFREYPTLEITSGPEVPSPRPYSRAQEGTVPGPLSKLPQALLQIHPSPGNARPFSMVSPGPANPDHQARFQATPRAHQCCRPKIPRKARSTLDMDCEQDVENMSALAGCAWAGCVWAKTRHFWVVRDLWEPPRLHEKDL